MTDFRLFCAVAFGVNAAVTLAHLLGVDRVEVADRAGLMFIAAVSTVVLRSLFGSSASKARDHS